MNVKCSAYFAVALLFIILATKSYLVVRIMRSEYNRNHLSYVRFIFSLVALTIIGGCAVGYLSNEVALWFKDIMWVQAILLTIGIGLAAISVNVQINSDSSKIVSIAKHAADHVWPVVGLFALLMQIISSFAG